jgi:hypothetical protein
MKTLFFEGAGRAEADTSKATDMKNCRVRTAFTNDEGQKIYLEMTAHEVTKRSTPKVQHFGYAGWVTDCSYITGDRDDYNNNRVKGAEGTVFEYNKENVLRFVNSLGCSFEKVETLPDLAGYRVFKEGREGYNYGDEFIYNPERTARAEKIHKHFYELEKTEREEDKKARAGKFVHSPSGTSYPNFSLWIDENDPELLHLLRHYNGYNKHWTIRNIENWQETVKETQLGQYGC